MKYKNLEEILSKERLNKYLLVTSQDKRRAIRLYKANLKVSQAFLPVFSVFEVVLRNKLDSVLEHYFGDADWILNQKQHLGGKLANQIISAEKRLKEERRQITKGGIITSQMMGFWTQFFEKNTFKQLKGSPIHAFANKPKIIGRHDIYLRLNNIRRLRNRVYHNEPICFDINGIGFSEASMIHMTVYEMLAWIDPEALKLLKALDKVQATIKSSSKV